MEKRRRKSWGGPSPAAALINSLDDGCLMHIFSFLSPLPDRYNSALVCQRWWYLACHPRLWLRVERSIKTLAETGGVERPIKTLADPGVFTDLEAAVSAARPGDIILIAAGEHHVACSIQINKPLCLMGGGDLPDDTVLTCSRGSESALEFLSMCKVANLTVRAELGYCLLHRRGRLTIEGCVLQCEKDPLDHLSYPIVSTANGGDASEPLSFKGRGDGVTVSRTRFEGGSMAVCTRGSLVLQQVRAMFARRAIFLWLEVGEK